MSAPTQVSRQTDGYEFYSKAFELARSDLAETLAEWSELQGLIRDLKARIKGSNLENDLHQRIENEIEVIEKEFNSIRPAIRCQMDANVVLEKLLQPAMELVERGNQSPYVKPDPHFFGCTPAGWSALAEAAPRIIAAQLARGDGVAATRTIASFVTMSRRAGEDAILDPIFEQLERIAMNLPPSGLEEIQTTLSRSIYDNTSFELDLLAGPEYGNVTWKTPSPDSLADEVRDQNPDLARMIDSMSQAKREALLEETLEARRLVNQEYARRASKPESTWFEPVSCPRGISNMAWEIIDQGGKDGLRWLAWSRTAKRLAVLQLKAARWTWATGKTPRFLEDFTTPRERVDPLNGRRFQFQRLGPRLVRIWSLGVPETGEIRLIEQETPTQSQDGERSP